MADLFYTGDVVKLLENKHVLLLGDSNTRALYKDLVWLLNENRLISQVDLKKKQQKSFSGDKLGKHSGLVRGREYEEERLYQNGKTRVEFKFITRCYTPMIVDMMEDIHLGLMEAPDVIYFSSTQWDLVRWGPNGVIEFKDNLQKLARLLKSSLPETTLFIWATGLPTAERLRCSLLIKQIEFLRHTIRFDILEANAFARQVMANHGFDVLDMYFHTQMQIHRRTPDGVHYLPPVVRLHTNLLLTHIALSWDFPLPNRVETKLLEKAKAEASSDTISPPVQLESPQQLSTVKPKKGKKQPAAGQSVEKRSGRRARGNRGGKWKGPGSVYNALNRRGRSRVKMAGGRQNWRRQSPEEERRERERWSPPTARTSVGSVIQPWIEPPQQIQPQNWSEDHWPEEQQFSNEPRFRLEEREQMFQNGVRPRINPWAQSGDCYQNSQRYQNEPRYRERFPDEQLYPNSYTRETDPRFYENLRQVSNTIDILRRRQLLSHSMNLSRYMPY